MQAKFLVLGLVTGILGTLSPALAQAAPVNSPPAKTAAPASTLAVANRPGVYTIPAGTKVLLTMKSALNTKTARPGDGVYLVSSFPVVIDSHILIPDGSYVQGVVDRVKRPGRIKGRAQISMHFTKIILPSGQVVPIPGSLNSLPGSDGANVKGSEGNVEQSGNQGRDAGTVVKGAGLGAAGGSIAGAAAGSGAVSGLAYGGAAGAAAGALYTLFTRGNDITIPAGASVEMVFERPMTLAAQQYPAVGGGQSAPQQFVPLNPQQPLQKPERQ